MKVLVTGAGGFIGNRVVRALAARGHQVIACVRNPQEGVWPEGVTTIRCDYVSDHTPEVWLPRLHGIDAVVNAVGIIRERGVQTFDALHYRAPAALFRACEMGGVQRVVQISAAGADKNAFSRYHRTKLAADDLLSNRRLEWVILRPSLVYGEGGGSNTLFHALAALPLIPVVGDGAQVIRPVHISDLTRAVVASVETPAANRRRIDVVGAEEVTFTEYLQRLRTWLGFGPAHTLRVPETLALHGARVTGFLGKAPVTAETIAMLRCGNTAPAEPFEETFGFRPSGVAQWLAARRSLSADRQQAWLYWLRPLLRISIGFVWVWAAVTSAWLFPRASSEALLAPVGISGPGAGLALYAASALDLVLGLSLWAGRGIRLAAWTQVAVMIAYTAIITWYLPEYWLHPFGPVAKNIPLLAATLTLIVLEDRKP